jgi:hypothetical protein
MTALDAAFDLHYTVQVLAKALKTYFENVSNGAVNFIKFKPEGHNWCLNHFVEISRRSIIVGV